MFDRAGVFASGFDIDAVTAVCAGSGSSSLDVAEVVGSLVDKSMVIADCREPGTRYWLLETLRQYALEQLAADDAEQAVRTAHAEHFNALARELRLSNEIDDGPTAGILEREWENFRAALRWALDSGDIDRAASLAANLSMSLDISRDEHQRWVEAVLAVRPKDHRMAAILYCLAGWWANLLGDHNEALRLAHRGLAVGSTFAGAHGLSSGGDLHEQELFKVVGVLAAGGSVLDRLVLTSVESVWEVHEHGGAAERKEITALLIQYATPLAAATMPRQVNASATLQAASPAYESARLFRMIGVGADVLRAFGLVLVLVAGLSVFIALLNALEDRRYDLAVMRMLGASRAKLMG